MAVESSTMIALRKINYSSTMAEILPVLQSISEIQHYECVEFFRNTKHTYENAPARNVVAAALTGLVLGGEFMTCDMYEGARPYCVDPFLNQLRNAMLRVPKIQAMTKENANSFLFYPEFTVGGASIRERVVRAALAHSSMTPANDAFVPLYSLGGYFDAKTTLEGIPKSFGRGTTCIMTARAVYQAAGAKMIGQKLPTVTTPGGAAVDLGVPSLKVDKKFKKYTDPEVDRVQFNDLAADPPPLAPGDIFMIAGHGDASFLLRPETISADGKGGDLAVHVGIVAVRNGSSYWTVDGGAGSGNEIEYKGPRTMRMDPGVGWTLGSSSYSAAQLMLAKEELDKYSTNEAVEQWINTNPSGVIQRANLAAAKKNLEAAKGNAALLPAKQKAYEFIIAAGKRLIKIEAGKKAKGSSRTIQGWWAPDLYQHMKPVTEQDILSRLDKLTWFNPAMAGRYSPVEAMR